MMKYLPFLLFLLLKAGTATAQNNLVVNGIPWFDDKGNIFRFLPQYKRHVH